MEDKCRYLPTPLMPLGDTGVESGRPGGGRRAGPERAGCLSGDREVLEVRVFAPSQRTCTSSAWRPRSGFSRPSASLGRIPVSRESRITQAREGAPVGQGDKAAQQVRLVLH